MGGARLILIAGLFSLVEDASAQEIIPVVGRRECVQQPCCPPARMIGPDGKPVQPDMTAVPPATDAFAQAGEGGTAPAASFQPGFFGDFLGISGTRALQGIDTFPIPVLRVPSAALSGGVKISDGESPRPQDRVYYLYNDYTDVGARINTGPFAQSFQVFRHLIGVEKTFLQGDVSLGLRLPFVLVTGAPGFEDNEFADMSIIAKYAIINNRETGGVLSTGIVVTVPTGQGFTVDLASPFFNGITGSNPTTIIESRIQPFVGWIHPLTPNLYSQGFTSVIIPTDPRDVTIFCFDTALGYYLYRNPADRFVQALVPMLELHTNTPLDKGPNSIPIGFGEQANLTTGAYVLLPRSVAGFATCVPLVGPKPYSMEYTVYCQLWF